MNLPALWRFLRTMADIAGLLTLVAFVVVFVRRDQTVNSAVMVSAASSYLRLLIPNMRQQSIPPTAPTRNP